MPILPRSCTGRDTSIPVITDGNGSHVAARVMAPSRTNIRVRVLCRSCRERAEIAADSDSLYAAMAQGGTTAAIAAVQGLVNDAIAAPSGADKTPNEVAMRRRIQD